MSTLHEEFRGAINDGDERLRDHIDQTGIQLAQQLEHLEKRITEVITGKEALEVERVERLRSEVTIIVEALDRRITDLDTRLSALIEKTEEVLCDKADEGHARLREHILAQVTQISSALENARREAAFAHEASEKAIAVAGAANEKRFEYVNGVREQLSEQNANFLPREVAEAQFTEMRRTLNELADKVGKIT